MTKTKKTKLLFLALFLAQLKPGGRYACIVPHGVLFGSSTAHQQIRQTLVDGHKLDGVISMPSGVFKPYAGVSTAILLFTKTNFGGTDHVWFYDMTADGFSLDDKRDPTPDQNDIPDILEKWQRWRSEIENQKSKIENSFADRHAKAFCVPVEEIRGNKYDLSTNRYKEIAYEDVKYDPPHKILDHSKPSKPKSPPTSKHYEGCCDETPTTNPTELASVVTGLLHYAARAVCRRGA